MAEGPVVPVYILDDAATGLWALGGAQRWWLHHSLMALDAELKARGSRLLLLSGDAVALLAALAAETGATAVHAIEHFEPWARRQQDGLDKRLRLCLHPGHLLAHPQSVTTAGGTPFKVFTPFFRALQQQMPPAVPVSAPAHILSPDALPEGERLDQWNLLPRAPDWAAGFSAFWRPGEAGARAKLEAFIAEAAAHYADNRNVPGSISTSRLSPHLHFGEISVAEVWHGVADAVGGKASAWLRQLVWRDFSAQLIWQSPTFPEQNWRPDFDRFPWASDPAALQAWQRGRTGYPLVDAGMRELWATGWMHNRVRMVTASFLSKHLMIDWREGEAWFWDTLLDADLGNNAAGWQWVAGSGADAAPYYRIFNPVTQSERFDPDGAYIRRWVPELSRLDSKAIHAPWLAPPLDLAAAGVRLGQDYPLPLVDHAVARARALAAYESLKAD